MPSQNEKVNICSSTENDSIQNLLLDLDNQCPKFNMEILDNNFLEFNKESEGLIMDNSNNNNQERSLYNLSIVSEIKKISDHTL